MTALTLRGPERRAHPWPVPPADTGERRQAQRREDYRGECFCGKTFTDPAAFDLHLRQEMAAEDARGVH